MFDGRFDRHFAEIFVVSISDEDREARPGSTEMAVFALVLWLIALFCMGGIG